ncbi:MAG: CoA-binding protein [Desulfobacteraceae bacterium]
MEFFFKPDGIALIGATPNPLKGGNAILKNLKKGFKNGIYPVNPKYKQIEDLTCYPSIREIPHKVDIAIVFVPGKFVYPMISECAEKGIKGVIIESSGFAESGREGLQMQKKLADAAEKAGIRLWGPNCMGVVDVVHKKILSFVSPSIWDSLLAGDVSLIVQSGMLSGAFLIDTMSHQSMGISKVCSIGNKMDVSECEILEYLIQDKATRVIGLYLESFASGRRFIDICSQSTKPIVLLKGGKSEKGARAAMGHTASMAGNNEIVKGAMAQAGVTQADDFQHMMDICRSLSAYPENFSRDSKKGRIAVLTYTGGAGIVSSDFIDTKNNVEMAELSPSSRDLLEKIFPEWMPVANPIDLWPAVERNGVETAYGTAIKAVCRDPYVDGILIHAFAGGFALNLDIESLAAEAGSAGKPLFCWLLGERESAMAFQIRCNKVKVPVFREIFRAVECMDAVFSRQHLTTGQENAAAGDSAGTGAFPVCLPETEIPETSELTILDEFHAKKILASAEIPVTEEDIAQSPETAAQAALKIGFPVVMKGLVPNMVHKTESGLVSLNIRSKQEVEEEFKRLDTDMKHKGNILVQQQIKIDVELILKKHIV